MIRKAVYACIFLHFTRKCVKKVTYPATKKYHYDNLARRILAMSEKIRRNSVYGSPTYVISAYQHEDAWMSVKDMYPHVMEIYPKAMETTKS